MSKVDQIQAQLEKLSPHLQARIESKIDQMGLRLADFPHHRLPTAIDAACVGDYRVIYTVDAGNNVIQPLAIGRRREIYRSL
jgi:mRNA-degrading endonuclease RelE of RelBE toxin-antitoxin system